MSLRFRIMFSSACAVLAVLMCLAYADSVRAGAERERSEALQRLGGEVASLVVASVQLEPGDVVSRSNVMTRDWVADLAPEGALTDMDDVVGREVGVAAAKGVPLTELNFRRADDAVEVPSGHVALTLPVTDKLGISRSVTKGTSLVAYAVTVEGTQLLSDDMMVLSEPAAVMALSSNQQVTVAVLPDDVADVLGASATGDLRLVVPADDVDVGLRMRDLAPEEVVDMEISVAKGDEAA